MYNEENNIEKCVDILRAQTEQNFTAIFIDDGSADDTVDKLLTNLKTDPVQFQYKLLQQTNQGAAKARETGIYSTTTSYAFTLDADDYITADFIEKINTDIKLNSSDISLPDFQIQQKDGNYNLLHYPDDKKQFTGLECLKYSLGKWLVPGIMCAKKEIFIKSYELYKQYNPQEYNYMNNDEVINRLNYYHAEIVTRNFATYSYLCNPSSTTKKLNPNRYLMAKNAMILYQIFGRNMSNISVKMQEEYINVLWGLIKYLKKNKKELPNTSQWKTQIKEMYSFVEPDLKDFKPSSFKLWSRLWVSQFYLRWL